MLSTLGSRVFRLLSACCLLFGALIVAPQAIAQPIRLDANFTQLSLREALPTLAEPSEQALTAEALVDSTAFNTESYQASLQPGGTAYWYRLVIQRRKGAPHGYHLQIDNDILTHLDFYLMQDGKRLLHQALGVADRHRMKSRFEGTVFNFHLLDERPVTLLIRKQSVGPSIMPLTLYNDDTFEDHLFNQYLFWGGVVAVLMVIALYNFFIYALVGNRSYRWYLVFYCVTFFYFAALHGFGALLWGEALQRWLAQHIMTLNFLLLWVVLHFANEFLDASENAPAYSKRLWIFDAALPAGMLLSFWMAEYRLIPIFGVMQLSGSLFAIAMAVTAYRHHFRPARFFILSWTFVILGAALGIMTFTNLVSANFFTLHAFFFGTLVELILLSIALADRLQHSERLAISQAFTDPQTQLPNYSFFSSPYFALEKQTGPALPLAMVLIKVRGLRHLLGLLGPKGYDSAYRSHITRIESYLSHSDWCLAFELPNAGRAHLISLPGEHLLLFARVAVDYESIVLPLLQLAENSLRIDKIDSKLSFQIGVCEFNPQRISLHECYRLAQLALLSCYSDNKTWSIYQHEQDRTFRRKLSLLADLRVAVEREQLNLFVQPQFELRSRRLCGGEVLVRWTHQQFGAISPAEFIPLAEESSLIFKITKMVIHKACDWLAQLKLKQPGFHLSINLSGLDLQHSELVPYIRWQIERCHLDPKQLAFEVTESAAMLDHQTFLRVIAELRSMGFTVAIDDFGTGYSSMRYLQQINAEAIKIDMSFVRNLHKSAVNQKIVSAIIQLARSTGAITIAEGVENDLELAALKQLGADQIQGYLFGEPVPTVIFEQRFLSSVQIESSH